jgi:hypothetical protein
VSNTLRRFLKTYRGSSSPTLAELDSGGTVVVKLRGSGNGAEALTSEYIVNRLAQAAGFPVPAPLIVELPDGFPWAYGTDEFHDLVRKSPGPNLGLAVIPGARPLPAERYRALAPAVISQLVTLDRTFSNWDRTEQSGNLLEDEARQVRFVDHGSCRFLAERDRADLPPLSRHHIFRVRQETFDATWLELIDDALVASTARELPEAWLTEIGLTREGLLVALRTRLRLARNAAR